MIKSHDHLPSTSMMSQEIFFYVKVLLEILTEVNMYNKAQECLSNTFSIAIQTLKHILLKLMITYQLLTPEIYILENVLIGIYSKVGMPYFYHAIY